MKKVFRNNQGFSLLEVVVVLSVLGALAAMMSPVVFRYIDDANRARTQADVNTIAAAIQQQYKDTGRWAFYKSGASKMTITSADDAAVLTSSPLCTGAPAAMSCDMTEPEADSGATWGNFTTALAGSLTDQLVKNTPSYTKWRGPYLDTVPAVDAWGRSYLVNIGKADPGDTTPEIVIAISAGPNGLIETTANTIATSGNLTIGGDDIVARVK